MNKNPPDTRTDRRDGRVHPVGVRAAAVPVGLVRRHRAAQGQGLPLQGGLPRGRAARQGGGRPDGRREHRQGQGDGAGPGRPDHARRDGDRLALRADQGRHARDPAPEEPAGGDLRRAGAGPARRAGRCPTAARWRARTWRTPSSSTRSSATFDPRTRSYFQEWLHDAGIASTGSYGSDLNDALGNAAPFFEGGADLLRPLDDQEVALRRVVRDTGRAFDADLARERPAARPGHERRRHLLGARLARRRAGGDVPDPADVPARDARHGRAAGALRRNTDPLVRDLREPADDLAPTLRDLGDLSPDLEQLFHNVDPLVDASATGVPAAERFLEGAEPVLESTHGFLRELNPILSYLSYSRDDRWRSSSPPAPARWPATARADTERTGAGGALPAAGGDHRQPLAPAAHHAAALGARPTPTSRRTPTSARSRSA